MWNEIVAWWSLIRGHAWTPDHANYDIIHMCYFKPLTVVICHATENSYRGCTGCQVIRKPIRSCSLSSGKPLDSTVRSVFKGIFSLAQIPSVGQRNSSNPVGPIAACLWSQLGMSGRFPLAYLKGSHLHYASTPHQPA